MSTSAPATSSSLLSRVFQTLAGGGSRTRSSMKPGMQQADIDFTVACPLLEMHEIATAGDAPLARQLYAALQRKWREAPLRDKILFANDSMTLQVGDMCRHVQEMDSGDMLAPAAAPQLSREERRASAAFGASIGPSSHSNPQPTLRMQMKHVHEEQRRDADIRFKDALTARHGFSLWVGPSQAATPDATAGLYLKGEAFPGTVVALYPGAVYNSEMLQKPVDAGHLGDPRVRRDFIPRFDECVLDVHDVRGRAAAERNPFALAQYARHPPRGVAPNVMRLQIDFVASTDGATGILAFPPHLRDYIPNVWGSDVTLGQELFGALEQNIWVKGVALIALRPLWAEELFVDAALNPFMTRRPDWYTPLDDDASKRTWARLGR